MRPEKTKGIGMATGHDRVDLGNQARIARSDRCRVRRSGAMIRQRRSLRKNERAWPQERTLERRALNSRVSAEKCQMLGRNARCSTGRPHGNPASMHLAPSVRLGPYDIV